MKMLSFNIPMLKHLLIFAVILSLFGFLYFKLQSSVSSNVLVYHHAHTVKAGPISINFFVAEAYLFKLKGLTTYFISEYAERSTDTSTLFLTFDDGNDDFYTDIFPVLKKYNIKATAYILAGYIGETGYMSKNELTEIIQSGLVEIGSHGVEHKDLTKISKSDADTEIYGSKSILDQQFNIDVKSFSYPLGVYNKALMDEVEKAGYSSAVTGDSNTLNDIYAIPRTYVSVQGIIKL
jgi:peptidoglycan/xylan/chitin deacetylase (PgdA/CDA1 family)